MKYQVRTWERDGRYETLTRGLTWAWTSLHNLRDRMTIARASEALSAGKLPQDVTQAVDAVCSGGLGAGIRPMQVPAELAGLIGQIAERKPKTILEIGTARGGTLSLLCQFAAPDATIISVDLPYARNGGGYPRWKEQHYRKFARAGQRLHLLRANSHAQETIAKVQGFLEGRGLDFVLIDADHSYEGVKQDYLNYRPLVSSGGLLALHDVVPNAIDPSIDVARFWDELEADPEVETSTIIADPAQGMYGIGLVHG